MSSEEFEFDEIEDFEVIDEVGEDEDSDYGGGKLTGNELLNDKEVEEEAKSFLKKIEETETRDNTVTIRVKSDEKLGSQSETSKLQKKDGGEVPQKIPTRITTKGSVQKDGTSKIDRTKKDIYYFINFDYKKQIRLKMEDFGSKFGRLEELLIKAYKQYEELINYLKRKHNRKFCDVDDFRECPPGHRFSNRCKLYIGTDTVTKELAVGFPVGLGFVKNLTDVKHDYPDNLVEGAKVFEKAIRASTVTTCTPVEKACSWNKVIIHTNSSQELMILVLVFLGHPGKLSVDDLKTLKSELKQFFQDGEGKKCRIVSLYLKVMNNSRTEKLYDCKEELIMGNEFIEEKLMDLKIHLTPSVICGTNNYGIESVCKGVEELLAPTKKTSVLMLGCNTGGLLGYSLSKVAGEVIFVDTKYRIAEAERNAAHNNIRNCDFVSGDNECDALVAIRKIRFPESCAVISSGCKRTLINVMVAKIRQMESLKRIVLVMEPSNACFGIIVNLSNPNTYKETLDPFFPVRAIPVDTWPNTCRYVVLVLMERTAYANMSNSSFSRGLSESWDRKVSIKNYDRDSNTRDTPSSSRNERHRHDQDYDARYPDKSYTDRGRERYVETDHYGEGRRSAGEQRRSSELDKRKRQLEEEDRRYYDKEKRRRLEERQKEHSDDERYRSRSDKQRKYSEEDRYKRRLDEQKRRQLEEERRKKQLEEERRKKKLEEEQWKKKLEEEWQKRQLEEEQEKKRLEEERQRKQLEEEELKKQLEEEQKKRRLEEARKKLRLEKELKKRQIEEEQKKKKLEEERRKMLLEKERQKKQMEEEQRRKQLEEQLQKKLLEEIERKKLEEEQQRKQIEEEQRRRRLEEEQQERKWREAQRKLPLVEGQQRMQLKEEWHRRQFGGEDEHMLQKSREDAVQSLISETLKQAGISELPVDAAEKLQHVIAEAVKNARDQQDKQDVASRYMCAEAVKNARDEQDKQDIASRYMSGHYTHGAYSNEYGTASDPIPPQYDTKVGPQPLLDLKLEKPSELVEGKDFTRRSAQFPNASTACTYVRYEHLMKNAKQDTSNKYIKNEWQNPVGTSAQDRTTSDTALNKYVKNEWQSPGTLQARTSSVTEDYVSEWSNKPSTDRFGSYGNDAYSQEPVANTTDSGYSYKGSYDHTQLTNTGQISSDPRPDYVNKFSSYSTVNSANRYNYTSYPVNENTTPATTNPLAPGSRSAYGNSFYGTVGGSYAEKNSFGTDAKIDPYGTNVRNDSYATSSAPFQSLKDSVPASSDPKRNLYHGYWSWQHDQKGPERN